MACIVKERDGRLAYRLFWDGYRSWEGTGVRTTDARRAAMERKAEVMSADMAEGRFDYLRWFPNGAKAHLFRKTSTTGTAAPKTLTAFVEKLWLPTKRPPAVRASLELTYKKHWRKHLKPEFGALPFTAITTPNLETFRARLTDPIAAHGRGLKMKTARDVIDGTFRALYRDARTTYKFRDVADDPFGDLKWPEKIVPKPECFTADERDTLLASFWSENRHYHAFVYTLFFTGMRTAEAVGLRWKCVNLHAGRLDIETSRTLGEDNAPKTKESARSLDLRPDVVTVLRSLRGRRDDAAFVFTTRYGTPLNQERFVEKHWRRALERTEVPRRKFYATRHTFITLSLEAGAPIRELAEYCGTSVEMIEKHYAKRGVRPETLAKLGGPTATPARRLAVAG
jgi:integrase